MSEDAKRGKVKIQGRIPRDEFDRYDNLQTQWGIDNGDAFRRVFSAGLESVEEKTPRQYLMTGVVHLAVIGIVMWILGRVMPNIPADSATTAAFLTFGVAALGIVAIGIMDMDLGRIRAGSSQEAAE